MVPLALALALALLPRAEGADTGADTGADSACAQGQWAACRKQLIQKIFNQSTVPKRKPDYILPNGSVPVGRCSC